MALTAPQIQSPAIPERLPMGQAVDMYSTLPLDWVQGPDRETRWLAGVTFVPRGVASSTIVVAEDPCVLLENSFATVQGFDEPVSFYPFRVENAIECSTLGGFTEEQLEQWIEDETRSMESYDLARQVWGMGGPNPDLRDQADVLTSDGTPVGALANVVAGLDRRLKGRRGLIHVAPDLLTRLVAAGALTFRGGEYQTANGHRVVADAGYDGSGPAGLALGTSWIYGSGPVYYRMSELEMPGQWWEAFNRAHNDYLVQIQRYVLYMFEPAYVVGASATVETSNG